MNVKQDQPSQRPVSVLISILNWNTAAVTLKCVASIIAMLRTTTARVEILVIDNNSAKTDLAMLRAGLASTSARLRCEPDNLGFTGGHNIAIDLAIQECFDFIWLVNSDTLVERNTLPALLATMEADQRCGIVSPVIMKMHDPDKLDFCGGFHDWKTRLSTFPESVEAYETLRRQQPQNLWVLGTAALYRIDALKQTGPLDNRLFAYYDDDDICARMSAAGWMCRIDFAATIRHVAIDRVEDRKPYFFYLMQRNHLIFWHANTPKPYRRLLLPKLLNQAFFEVNRLYLQGKTARADARMLAIGDFLCHRYGAPMLDRPVPLWMKALGRLARLQQTRALANVSRTAEPVSPR